MAYTNEEMTQRIEAILAEEVDSDQGLADKIGKLYALLPHANRDETQQLAQILDGVATVTDFVSNTDLVKISLQQIDRLRTEAEGLPPDDDVIKNRVLQALDRYRF